MANGEPRGFSASPVLGLREISPGTDLAAEVLARTDLRSGDVLVISQKVVSKAEGRVRRLDDVVPGHKAQEIARESAKDPRLVELILRESVEVLRSERGVLITRTPHGFVCANSGIDSSNVPEHESVVLLPEDPDESARRLRAGIREGSGTAGEPAPAVLITDSFGRSWRLGQSEVAIGAAGLVLLDDWRGRADSEGRELTATAIAVADEMAAAADLARSKTSRTPAVVLGGLERYVTREDGAGIGTLVRPRKEDLFT